MPLGAQCRVMGERRQQHHTIRVHGIFKKRLHGGNFDNLAGVDHCHAVAEMRCNSDIAGDEQHRSIVRADQSAQQVQHLRLNGNIKPAGGIIRDHELGRTHERDRHHNTLRHAARKLMGIRLEATGRVRYLHRVQHVHRHLVSFIPLNAEMSARDVRNLSTDRYQRIKFAPRIRNDHGNILATNGPQLFFRQGTQVLAIKLNGTLINPARLHQKPHDGARKRRLARAALTHEANDLARLDMQVQVAYRLHRFLAVDGIADIETINREDRLTGVGDLLGFFCHVPSP